MALIGPMKYLTIGGSTYEIQGQEITSSAITSALGYTPYNGSTNPNGYISNYTDVNVTSTAVTAGTTHYIVGSTNSSTITGTLSKHASAVMYTTANSDTNGYTQLRLGNTTATSSAGGKEGQIRLYGTNATYYVNIKGGAQTANHNLTLPNADGTIALISDIPNVSGKIDTAGTGLSKSGTTLNHSNSVTAQTTQAVYPIKIDAQGHISAYGSAVTIPSDTKVTNTTVTAATTYYLTGSTNSSTVTGELSKHGSLTAYTTADSSTGGYTELRLGNTTSTTSAGGKVGQIRLYGTGATYYTTIKAGQPSSNNTLTLPTFTGTVALTSDIPTIPTKVSAFTNDVGYLTSFTDENVTSTASSGLTNYIVGSVSAPTSTGTLYKHTSASLYISTDSGTSGYTQLILGNATATTTAGGKEGQIRLYGTNATYYLDLKPGAIASSNKTITFPNATGTVALTSDIPTIPSAGSSASTVGTSASGGSATTWSRSDHVHNITSAIIGSAGGVTGVKINGTTYTPTSGTVDLGTISSVAAQIIRW